MACKVCGSADQGNFRAEINLHFPGIANLNRPSVLVFPELLVCLACGFAEFTMSDDQLRKLKEPDSQRDVAD